MPPPLAPDRYIVVTKSSAMGSRKIVTIILALASIGVAQTPPVREFEAATVKIDNQKGPPFLSVWKVDPTRLSIVMYSLQALVESAFDLKPYQVEVRAPAAVADERFD